VAVQDSYFPALLSNNKKFLIILKVEQERIKRRWISI